jgi:hypothetical protein
MFQQPDFKSSTPSISSAPTPPTTPSKRAQHAMNRSNYRPTTSSSDVTLNDIDSILENEKQRNKAETWNKLDKTVKMQKLNSFAEKYGNTHGFSSKTTIDLKSFFAECLDKSKLQKAKELVYDKEKQEIISIPTLSLNNTTNTFTLRIIDNKRVSTLKSLTPLRNISKN